MATRAWWSSSPSKTVWLTASEGLKRKPCEQKFRQTISQTPKHGNARNLAP